jgi:uncharacterized delta-60 repeat protein
MFVRKLWLALAFCVLVVGAMTGTSVAQARLDPSFGQRGLVEVQPPLPAPWRDQYVRHLAAARGGSSFALFERLYCAGQAGCSSSNNLFRYQDDGSLDSTFGGAGGSYELPQEGEGIPTLAVDSLGRPLLAQTSPNRVVVRRLTASGVPDPSFGTGGAVALDCNCEYNATQLVPGPRGMVTAVLSRSRFGEGKVGGYSRTGTILTLVRLRANGSKDRSFGHGGSVTFGLQGVEPPVASATSGGGALYLGGVECCGFGIPGYIVRVSARGRLDGRFTTASQRSLRSLRRLNSLQVSVNSILLRPRGGIDLLGAAGYEKGFVLRLNPSGHLHHNFGKNGLRGLALPVASAALGSDGATVAVSDENLRGVDVVMRILASGRLDPAFGKEGEPIVGSKGDSGVSVVHQSRRKALVLDLGFHECRGYCPASPKLVRFLEGTPKRG